MQGWALLGPWPSLPPLGNQHLALVCPHLWQFQHMGPLSPDHSPFRLVPLPAWLSALRASAWILVLSWSCCWHSATFLWSNSLKASFETMSGVVLLWLEPPLANDFCNFLNKIDNIMKIFVEVNLLEIYQPLCNAKQSDQLFLSHLISYNVAQKAVF